MPTSMPYRATTSSGEVLDYDFVLHPHTQSAVRVSQLLSAQLASIDREVALTGDTGNGDVLQALAMALAVRVSMVPVSHEQTAELAGELLRNALVSAQRARRHSTPVGHG
ncbi:MAG: hypothetical protein AB8G17_08735 [Gammaproteobacteria bacterium]